jgi:hypothetical protein
MWEVLARCLVRELLDRWGQEFHELTQRGWPYLVGIFLLSSLGGFCLLRDAQARGLSRWNVFWFCLLVPGLGILCYLALRPAGRLHPCPYCQRWREENLRVCPFCHHSEVRMGICPLCLERLVLESKKTHEANAFGPFSISRSGRTT